MCRKMLTPKTIRITKELRKALDYIRLHKHIESDSAAIRAAIMRFYIELKKNERKNRKKETKGFLVLLSKHW